jgi:hypothetical protein
MSNHSKNFLFRGTRAVPRHFSPYGSSKTADGEGAVTEAGLIMDIVTGVGIGLSGIAALGSVIINPVISFSFNLGVTPLAIGSLIMSSFFMLGQCALICTFGYFLPSLLCLLVFFILFANNVLHDPYMGGFTLSWYIASIPLYLTPVAFAAGVIYFYIVVLKPKASFARVEDDGL